MYDVVVIGAGPAGLTAALYALRADKRVLVLEKKAVGGQILDAARIENYPGFLKVSGKDFVKSLSDQVRRHGADFEMDEALEIREEEDCKVVVTAKGAYETKTVIIAAGGAPRRLDVPGEEELAGDGVSYCAICDGAVYKNKSVAIIGGGNSAVTEAIQLADRCSRVTVVQDKPFLTAEEKLQKLLFSRPNVKVICNTVVESVERSGAVTVHLINMKENKPSAIHVECVFVAIGRQPECMAFRNAAELDRAGYIVAGEDCACRMSGVFVAGDCRTKDVRQVTTATADGTVAALAAIRYLEDV